MKTSIKKTLTLIILITALTLTFTGTRYHHRNSVNNYFDHPALEQLALAWQGIN